MCGPGSAVRCTSAWHEDGRGFNPRVRQHSFKEICHLYLALIQAGQLSVTGERMFTLIGSLPRNNVARLTDRLDMNIVVDWDVKPQIKQTNSLCNTTRNILFLYCST